MSSTRFCNTLPLIVSVAFLAACGQSGTEGAEQASADAVPETAPVEAAPAETSAFATAALIDPNTAPEEILAAVPGMTEAAAAAITGGRPFATPSEMDAAVGET